MGIFTPQNPGIDVGFGDLTPAEETFLTTLAGLSFSNGDVLTISGGTPVWAAPSGGGGAWGDITGTLSDQTDLQSALDLKAPLTTPTFVTSIISPIVYGSSAANGDLILRGTSNATKTTSFISLQDTGGWVGVGTATPATTLDIVGIGGSPSGVPTFPLRITQGQDNPGFIFERTDAEEFIGAMTGSAGSQLVFSSTLQRFTIGANAWADRYSISFPALPICSFVPDATVSGGRVGINSSNPGNMLTINTPGNDSLPALGANGGKLGLFNNNEAYGLIVGVDGNTGDAWFQSQRIDGGASGYGIRLCPNTGGVGIGDGSSSSASLIIKAGTATVSPFRLVTGTNKTTPIGGSFEYNNSFYLTKSTTLRFGLGGSIFEHFASVGNVTTGEDDLYSDTIPVSTLAVDGDKLSAEYGGVFVSSATATRQIKIYFGGTAILDTGALTLSLSSAWTVYVTIIRVSSTVVRYMCSLTTEGAALAAYTSVGELTGLTLSNTNILKITGEAAGVGAATNDIVAMMSSVRYDPAAGL
jgi:hypothetical protein